MPKKEKIDWSDWLSGYMYCCDVADARKTIPSMPQIQVMKLIIKVVFAWDFITFFNISGGGADSVSNPLDIRGPRQQDIQNGIKNFLNLFASN